jgi:cell division protein FtsL
MKQWIHDIQSQWAEINSWPQLLHYIGQKGIVNNIKFFAYCVVLILLYIAVVHSNENMLRNISKTSKLLKETSWQYKDEKSKLMFLTKESELAKKANQLGLQLNVEVPSKIIVSPSKPSLTK